MANAIVDELGSYTGEPQEVVLEKMARGKDDLKRMWLERQIDVSNPEEVAAFYRDHFVEAYELADWHCGRTNGEPPLNYARAATFARRHRLARVLDFGSGIGSGSLALAYVGCEVHSADIATSLLPLVDHRMRARGYLPHLIDLAAGMSPLVGHYDLITCFDVLEHVPDQLSVLRRLERYLQVGGYLMVNLAENPFHADRPMHISASGGNHALIRRTAMTPVWSECCDDFQVLKRSRLGRLHNCAAAGVALCRKTFTPFRAAK
jgi:2-polyprenyl-3-methyl-5-hydroxy-6-metoxy-1,4-benzoquinol methylase